MPRWSELVCDLKLALVMLDLDRERRSQARPSGLVSGQAWREGVAPCSVVRAALYVIAWPRSSGRDPRSVARGSRIGDLLSSSSVGVRDPWRVLRQLARVGLDACSMASIRGSVFVIREPWRAGRVRFSSPWLEFFEGGGSKKMAGFVKAGANARFHTLDVLQNSFSSTWNHPHPGRKKGPG